MTNTWPAVQEDTTRAEEDIRRRAGADGGCSLKNEVGEKQKMGAKACAYER
jgi:hypothetical protein